MDSTMLARELIDALVARHQTISLCESLTAGLASATLATVPGASAALRGGLVVYATDLKHSLAGVPEAVLAAHGPVSPVTAREMARGTRRECSSDWAVAVTGVAGPDSQDGHPVGEVWVGVAGPKWTASAPAIGLTPTRQVRYTLFPGAAEPVRVLAGNRQEIREAAVGAVLRAALTAVREQKLPQGR